MKKEKHQFFYLSYNVILNFKVGKTKLDLFGNFHIGKTNFWIWCDTLVYWLILSEALSDHISKVSIE